MVLIFAFLYKNIFTYSVKWQEKNVTIVTQSTIEDTNNVDILQYSICLTFLLLLHSFPFLIFVISSSRIFHVVYNEQKQQQQK